MIRVGRQGDGKEKLPVDLKQLEEEQRLITGVHEVYGEMYRLLGLDALLPRSRYWASHDALFHVVMARVANPDSKRGSVRPLEEDFGVSLPVEKVYRMSPEVIRSALVYRQCSILRCRHSGNRHVVPSKPTPAAEQIYAIMGLPLTTTPYQFS